MRAVQAARRNHAAGRLRAAQTGTEWRGGEGQAHPLRDRRDTLLTALLRATGCPGRFPQTGLSRRDLCRLEVVLQLSRNRFLVPLSLIVQNPLPAPLIESSPWSLPTVLPTSHGRLVSRTAASPPFLRRLPSWPPAARRFSRRLRASNPRPPHASLRRRAQTGGFVARLPVLTYGGA